MLKSSNKDETIVLVALLVLKVSLFLFWYLVNIKWRLGRQAGRQADSQTGRQAGKQADG